MSEPNGTALRYSKGRWTQILPTLGQLAPGDVPGYVAPEPGRSAAWMSVELSGRSADLQTSADEAHVAEVTGGGGVTEQALGTAQGVGPRGSAGPIQCPAANDCWMATTNGWLFHWTDGRALTQDTDPSFHTLITFRPPDAGVPQIPSDTPPVDDSLANQQPAPDAAVLPPTPTVQVPPVKRRPKKLPPLVRKISRPAIVGRGKKLSLRISFTLTARAHVQFQGLIKKKVVAHSKRVVMAKGRRSVQMAVTRKAWPKKLKLAAKPYKAPKKTSKSKAKPKS